MSLTFAAEAAGAAGAAGAWSRTFSIQVYMNFWKRLLVAGAGAGSGPGAKGPGVGRLLAGLSRRTGGIVESGEWERSEERRRSKEQRRSGKWRVTPLAFQIS